jgi:REP element-mobilizing transposase RayT
MTNHVHLLFDPSDDVKSIGLLMKRLAGRQTRMSTIQDHCVRIVIKAWGHVLLLAFSQIVSKVFLFVKGKQRAQSTHSMFIF